MSVDKAKMVVETAREYRRKTMVGFNGKFIPVSREAKHIVKEGISIT